jgi:hypothetical protein
VSKSIFKENKILSQLFIFVADAVHPWASVYISTSLSAPYRCGFTTGTQKVEWYAIDLFTFWKVQSVVFTTKGGTYGRCQVQLSWSPVHTELLPRCSQHAYVLVTGPFSQQGPLYGIGCHNPSGLPITFHHSKASLKHMYFFNAMAILLKAPLNRDFSL